MKFQVSNKLFFLFCLFSFPGIHLHAQELNVAQAYDKGVKAMESGQIDAGLKVVDDVITNHSAKGKQRYGSVFGHFYYLKGMLHIKKKEYPKAIQAFKTCTEDYTNEEEDLPNVFINEALSQWAGCLMALKDYNGATQRYQAALSREEKFKPTMNRLEAQINLSKSMMLSGKSAKGKEFVEKNLNDPNATDAMKRSLFLILIGDWSQTADLKQVENYFNQYKQLMEGDTLVNRYMKQNPVYNHLASEAIQSKDPNRALFWYDQMLDPVKAGQAYTQRIKALKAQTNSANKKVAAEIQALQKEVSNQSRQLAEILMGRGSAYYAKGRFDDALKQYLELSKRYPRHPQRAVILHNQTMSAVKLSKLDDAAEYGTQFFREFPKHELRASMASTLVDVLFVQQKFDEAYRVASKLKDTLSTGSAEAEVPAFVALASLYHLNRYDEAQVELDNYFSTYPDGTRTETARYYQGLIKVGQQQWAEALVEFDQFLERYKQSDLRPAALYFSGLSHFVTGSYPLANSRIIELQAKHPRAEEVPNSYNVLGDILSAREKPYKEITDSYKKALDMTERKTNPDGNVAGYSLRQLITQAVAAEKWQVATSHYDRFKKDYHDSSWSSDVLISAIPALVETDRKDEAETALVDFVNQVTANPEAGDLDEVFDTYHTFLSENYETKDAQKKIQQFPATSKPTQPALQAWLYLGEIKTLSEAKNGKKNHKEEIQSIFKKLNQLYQDKGNSLSNYALVQVARYNSENGGNDSDAREVYQYILKERPTGDAMGMALVDLAKLEVKTNTPTSRSDAKDLFKRILNEVDDETVHEEAVLGLARIEMLSGPNYEAAEKYWKQYRSTAAWRSARAEASYQYGVCLQNKGDRNEAAAIYVNVYSQFPGQLDWSTKAYIEAAKIIKANGEELDALKLLREMIQRMGHLKHPGVEEGRKLFYSWREAYVAKQKK